MNTDNIKIVILGAGLAGLGASIALKKQGYDPIILEKSDRPGGLFTNYSIEGCDFDFGPKLLILDDSENSQEILSYLDDNYEQYPIEESVYLKKYGILRFPLQRYLIELPEKERNKAIKSLQYAQENPREILNFKDWLIQNYGEYFAHLILIPYETKKWRIDLNEMDYRWALNRPVKVSLEEVIEGSKRYLPSNKTYYYPKSGNITELTNAMVKQAGEIKYNHNVTTISLEGKYVLAGGHKYDYDILISTLPLDEEVQITSDLPEKLKAYSSMMLKRLSIVVFNLVYKGNYDLQGTAIYFPDKDIIFRRVSVMENLCPALKRKGKTPITVEVSLNGSQYSNTELYKRVVADMKKIPQFAQMGKPIAYEAKEVPFAYPLQTRGHQYHVADLHRYYSDFGVFHCGRGGSFDYCNGDLAYKQGVDAAKRTVNHLHFNSPMKSKITFTVGLPTYNSTKSIIHTVKSIRNSQGTEENFPILISVDGYTMSQEIENELKKYNVNLIKNPKREGQTVRNSQLMQETKTDILILTQDDVLFEKDTIKKIIERFTTEENLTMLAPKLVPLSAKSHIEHVLHSGVSIAHDVATRWANGDNYLTSVGRCLVFKTEIAQRFEVPENLINSDAYYYFENKRLGGIYRNANDIIVRYRTPQTLQDHLKQVRKFVVSEKELSSILKKDLNEEYKLPTKILISALFKQFVKSPLSTLEYLFISWYARNQSKAFYEEVTHLWETDPSTKKLK